MSLVMSSTGSSGDAPFKVLPEPGRLVKLFAAKLLYSLYMWDQSETDTNPRLRSRDEQELIRRVPHPNVVLFDVRVGKLTVFPATWVPTRPRKMPAPKQSLDGAPLRGNERHSLGYPPCRKSTFA